jgi:hypothetical protein
LLPEHPQITNEHAAHHPSFVYTRQVMAGAKHPAEFARNEEDAKVRCSFTTSSAKLVHFKYCLLEGNCVRSFA